MWLVAPSSFSGLSSCPLQQEGGFRDWTAFLKWNLNITAPFKALQWLPTASKIQARVLNMGHKVQPQHPVQPTLCRSPCPTSPAFQATYSFLTIRALHHLCIMELTIFSAYNVLLLSTLSLWIPPTLKPMGTYSEELSLDPSVPRLVWVLLRGAS